MELFPYYAARLADIGRNPETTTQRWRCPVSPSFYAGQINRVTDEETAKAAVALAQQLPLCHIGMDFEFRYDRPGVKVKQGALAYDPRSIRPLLLALALTYPCKQEPQVRPGTIITFVFDLRHNSVLPFVRQLLQLPIPFVGHYLTGDLFCLFKLNLPVPTTLWDTWVASKALALGRHHWKYNLGSRMEPEDEIQVREKHKRQTESRHSLLSVCRRFSVRHAFAADKERLQRSFLDHAVGQPFSEEQIRYAAADAIAAAQLYPFLAMEALTSGQLQHLVSIEMPWVVVNAQTCWHGVRVDAQKCERVLAASRRHQADPAPELAAAGIRNVRSLRDLEGFFRREGLLDLCRRNGKVSFEDEILEVLVDRHQLVPVIRAARKSSQLQSDPLLAGKLVGADGRVHPEHRQLGTDTGRQTCRWPNVLGLGKVLRPLVIPDAGYGIGEVDLCQIEIGIAAAVYHDEQLVEMFNSGDAYCAMAKYFYRNDLSAEDQQLLDNEFKRKHADKRNRMKRCTLGIIYGLSPYGLAAYLTTSQADAKNLLDRFLAMFPSLRQALDDTVHYGAYRGYVCTSSGLRRYRAHRGKPSSWERNWMKNHPVQGSAAVVFKAAGIRLDRLYRQYGARLIIPLHDAYVFEAKLNDLPRVSQLTEQALCDAVREHFPALAPRAEINIHRPECWNKDGHADSVDRWIADPLFSLG